MLDVVLKQGKRREDVYKEVKKKKQLRSLRSSFSESGEEVQDVVREEKKDASRRMIAMNEFIDELYQDRKMSAGVVNRLKSDVNNLLLVIVNLEGQVQQLTLENTRLNEEEKKIRAGVEERRPTFPQIVTAGATGGPDAKMVPAQWINRDMGNKTAKVFISSSKGEDTKDMQVKVTSKINPVEDKIRIRESGKPFRVNHPRCTQLGSNTDLPIFGSLVQHEISTLDHVAIEDVTVELSQGFIRGSVGSTVSGVTFYSFQGLPYAQPPVGELRFKAPQKAPSWEGVRDASTVGSNCVQIPASDAYGSEDCLFINVYTPQLPDGNGTTSLLPVMLWIHGGAFTSGSGDTTWYGPGYLLDKEILLVTFNYRLGVLDTVPGTFPLISRILLTDYNILYSSISSSVGFLGLSHSEVSLNNGLKDQRAALRWVQQNIERFGGDPAQITIFGESAGGASVEYQLISPSASVLFQRAISQSGSVLSPWAYVDTATAQTRAQQLIQLLGYTSEDINDIYNFLMEASAENITIQQSNVITEGSEGKCGGGYHDEEGGARRRQGRVEDGDGPKSRRFARGGGLYDGPGSPEGGGGSRLRYRGV
uniref:Carboxylic ester hydrolase n=1 Tax=Timema monikensis TaxID=170555 RepID=A0A7R9HS20_9NEOP|nr:unnamed protein product [Timema monikensis]